MADTNPKDSEQAKPDQEAEAPKETDAKKQKEDAAQEEKKQKRRPILIAVGAVVAVIVLFVGIRAYLFNRVHVSTDDAYITGDLVNVSPQINGTLQQLMVQEGDRVKQGQLLATIDPSGPQASLRQAKRTMMRH